MNDLDGFFVKAGKLPDVSVSHDGDHVVATCTGNDEDRIDAEPVCEIANQQDLLITSTAGDFDSGAVVVVVHDPSEYEVNGSE